MLLINKYLYSTDPDITITGELNMITFRILYQNNFMGWTDEITLSDKVTEEDVRRAVKEHDKYNYKHVIEIFEI